MPVNPFKKILYWLDQIRRKQTTTFALKLSIPLIALPIVIAGVFTLGRIYGINFQKSQQSATPSPIPDTRYQIPNTTLSRVGTLKVARGTQTTYLLALKSGDYLTLKVPPTIDLTRYGNQQVLVTGSLDKQTGILTVTDIAEVQLFNDTKIPESTTSAK